MATTAKLSVLLLCLVCITVCVFSDIPNDKLSTQEVELNQVDHGIESMKAADPNNNHNKDTPGNGRRILKHNSTFIGFTAWKQSTQFFDPGDVIEFDGIILNEGGHYKEAFNWFQCPTNGVYFVAVTFQKYESDVLGLSVVKEGNQILQVHDHPTYNPWLIVSESCITRCDTDERIWVQGYYSSGAVYGSPLIPQTTFTVMKMDESDFNNKNNFHSTFAGFSAWHEGSQIYNNGDVILYQHFNFNEGGHFVPEVNRFICPVTGIYYVTANHLKLQDEFLQLSVVKNNAPILHTEDIWSDNYYTIVSNTRLVSCAEGEFIAVKATGSGQVWGNSNSPRTTFSAMLMYSSDETAMHSSFVGFTAYKKSNQSYDAGETITFEMIVVNEGNDYNPILNRFICPHNAIYYVSVTFKKFFTSPLQLQVEHETSILFQSIDTQAENPWITASNSALVRCFEGEELKVSGVTSGSVYGDESKAYTTFTVFMMYQY